MDNKLLLQDLAEAIAIKEGLTKKKSEAFIKALFETIEEGLTADKFVKIKGFGTFKIISVGERESVNINTGERFSIEGHEKITFTPDTMLKDLVNRPFAHFQTVIINDETDLEEMEQVEDEVSVTADDDEMSNNADKDTESPTEEVVIEENEKDLEEESEVSAEENLENNAEAHSKERPMENPSPSDQEVNSSTDNVLSAVSTLEPPINEESQETEDNSQIGEYKENDSTKEEIEAEEAQLGTSTEQTSPEDVSDEQGEQVIVEATVNPIRFESVTPPEKKKNPNDTVKEETTTSASRPPTDQNPVTPTEAIERKEILVTDQNDESQQQIKYIIKELESKRNIWKTISLILLSVLLLLLSYFAGYFRWFCPCETTQLNLPNSSNSCPVPTVENVHPQIADSLTDSISIVRADSINSTLPEVTTSKEERIKVTETVVTPPTTPQRTRTEHPKKSSQTEVNKKNTTPETNYRQLEGGKYKIVGTLGTHKIENGETIRTIALDVYGSKGYALYIITHNDLENPNMVDTGTIIKLPKLERRKK